MNAANPLPDFASLTPDVVLSYIEEVLGERATNLCRPLTSYINRVYEVQLESGRWVIAKFYRPGRWSTTAIQDEHDFLGELAAAEIPVVAPLSANGQTLHSRQELLFAIFPKRGGRPVDEPDERGWKELGRLFARVHLVGESRTPRQRIRIHPHHSARANLDAILAGGFPMPSLRSEYERVARSMLDRVRPIFDSVEYIRIHGDAHAANLIHRPGESLHIIDFDDMAIGPAVQDLWMLLPGPLRVSRPSMDLLLEGYETFRDLDRQELKLIEPLRGLRFLHFTAWCARQKSDGGFARLSPDWGSPAFWRQEINDLQRQLQEIEDAIV